MIPKLLSVMLILAGSVCAAQDSFALQLFRHAARTADGKSVVLSPIGVEQTLRQVAPGTGGATRAQLDSLPFGKPFTATESNVAPLITQAVFADETLPLTPAAGEVKRIPLTQAPQKAVEAINAWGNIATKGQINPLLDSAACLSPNSRLLVINAIHLKADWQYAFPPEGTEEMDFTYSDGEEGTVQLMTGDREFAAAGGRNWRAVALPYSGADKAKQPVYFVAILPRADAAGFAQHLTDDALNIIRRKLREKRYTTRVGLPRFSSRSKLLDFSATLKELGLRRIFSREADFTPWTSAPIRLASVRQKAAVEITENGTTATALTVAEMDDEGEEADCLYFTSPFVWFIGTLEPDSTPLFMGIWEGPERP